MAEEREIVDANGQPIRKTKQRKSIRWLGLTQTKKGTKWLVAVGGALAFLAGLSQSADTIYEFVRKFSPKQALHITAAKPFMNDDMLDQFGFHAGYGSKGSDEYVLVIAVGLKFKEDKFNNPAFLSTIEEIKTVVHNGETVWMKQARLEGDLKEYELALSGARKSLLRLVFDTKPKKGTSVSLDFGPLRKDLVLDNYTWEKNLYKNAGAGTEDVSRNLAFGKAEIAFDSPSWPVLSKARILVAPTGQPDLIEAVIDNHSGKELAVNNLYIKSHHPKSSRISCGSPDRPRSGLLSFEMLSGESDKPNTWFELDGQQVAASAEFSIAGACSPYQFKALVPLQQTIASSASGRIVVRISEFPELQDYGGLGAQLGFGTVPKRLSEWLDIEIAVNVTEGDALVFPIPKPLSRDGLPSVEHGL